MQRMTQRVPIPDLIYPGLNNITMQSYKSIDKTKSFESIIEKIADFSNADDLDQLLEDIQEHMVTDLNVPYASIMILEENQNRFHTVVADETFSFPHDLNDIVDASRLVNCTTEKGQLVLFAELADESEWEQLSNEEKQGLEKILCIPLIIRQRIMGVICIHCFNCYSEKLKSETIRFWSGLVSLIIEKYHYLNQNQKWREITQEELKRSQSQLIRSEKLISLAEIAMSVGHSIRNPITVIGGLCRRMYKDLPENDPKRKTFQIIISEASHLEGIVNEFNRFFSIEQISFQSMDINRLVNEAVDDFLSQFHGRAEFNLKRRLWHEPLTCRIDPDLFDRCIMHLLSNAREANGKGIEITIATSREGNDAIIEVIDSGKGMSHKEMNHVFDPFYTTKGKGGGMGLTFVHFVISEHSGHVDLMSEKGVGTQFRIRLPLESTQ